MLHVHLIKNYFTHMKLSIVRSVITIHTAIGKQKVIKDGLLICLHTRSLLGYLIEAVVSIHILTKWSIELCSISEGSNQNIAKRRNESKFTKSVIIMHTSYNLQNLFIQEFRSIFILIDYNHM